MPPAPHLQRALDAARTIGQQHRLPGVSSDLVTIGLLTETPIRGTVLPGADCGFVVDRLYDELKKTPRAPGIGATGQLTHEAKAVVAQAAAMQRAAGAGLLDEWWVLLSVVCCDTAASRWLKNRGWVFENICGELRKAGRIGTAALSGTPLSPVAGAPGEAGFWGRLPLVRAVLARRCVATAFLAHQFRDYEQTRRWGTAAWKLAPRSLQSGYAYCIADALLKQYERCIERAEEVVKRHPGAALVHALKAACLLSLARHDEAVKTYETAGAAGYDSAEVCNATGFVEADRANFAAAVRLYDEALRLRPEHAFALNNKGFALHHLGRTADGIAGIRQSLALDRGNAYAWRNLAVIALETGDGETAGECAAKAFLYHYRRDFGGDLDGLLRK